MTMQRQNNRRLDLSDWQMAWDRYALAAAVLEQFPFSKAMQHKALVLEISANAPAGQSLLGVFFDEVARKQWEDSSGRLGAAFSVEDVMGNSTEELMRRTKALFEATFPSRVRALLLEFPFVLLWCCMWKCCRQKFPRG